MNRSNIARQYREAAVRNASQVGLVVIMYDMIIEDLHRAIEAVRNNNVEKRANETRHMLAVLEQLQGTLDMDNGGEAAVNMDRLYSIARAKLLEANIKNSVAVLEELRSLFTELRAAWAQVEDNSKPKPGEISGNEERFSPVPAEPEYGVHDWSA